jgi:hypothetical protein
VVPPAAAVVAVAAGAVVAVPPGAAVVAVEAAVVVVLEPPHATNAKGIANTTNTRTARMIGLFTRTPSFSD